VNLRRVRCPTGTARSTSTSPTRASGGARPAARRPPPAARRPPGVSDTLAHVTRARRPRDRARPVDSPYQLPELRSVVFQAGRPGRAPARGRGARARAAHAEAAPPHIFCDGFLFLPQASAAVVSLKLAHNALEAFPSTVRTRTRAAPPAPARDPAAQPPRPPPTAVLPRTIWTRRVPRPVLPGHAASPAPDYLDTPRPPPRTIRTRRAPR